MPSAPASSSASSSRSQAARSDGEDERCHAGSPSITSDACRSAAGGRSQVHRGAGIAPGGREAVVQQPSVGSRAGVRLLDRHQPRLEVERRRDAVERLQALAGDGVHVTVQVDEAWPDHETGHVDDRRVPGQPRGTARLRRRPPGHRPRPRRPPARSRSAGRPRARRGESAPRHQTPGLAAAHWTIGQSSGPRPVRSDEHSVASTSLRWPPCQRWRAPRRTPACSPPPPGWRRTSRDLVDEHDVPERPSPCWRVARSSPPPAASRASARTSPSTPTPSSRSAPSRRSGRPRS